MALVAWAPKGYAAPIELLAVMLPPGPVTERQWIESLADRVSQMAIKAGPQATLQASAILDLPATDDPAEAGQYLVLGNLNLRTHLDLAIIDKTPFPSKVSSDPAAEKALSETTLEQWVELARAQVSASSLD